MEKTLHASQTRGTADHGWLRSRHTFSFAEYHNEQRMSFGALRVLNDDWIAPGQGFGAHPHKNMEIVTVPLLGALQHEDSTGGKGVIRKGEVQVMSAGTGIRHSEFNASDESPCELLQIWVLPEQPGIPPRYEQREFPREERKDRYQAIVSPDRREASLWINQNAFFHLAELSSDKKLPYDLREAGNGAYFFVISGTVKVADETLSGRDALGVTGEKTIPIQALEPSELLVIEVPL